MRVVHADHVLPGDSPPIADGAIVLDGGEVVEVGPASAVLPAHAGAPIERVGGVVFPGLVNAHTHLELSVLRGRVPAGTGFLAWVDRLVALRAEMTDDEDEQAVQRALDDLVGYATVAVGEVTNALLAVQGLAQRGIRGCVFHEVLGLDRSAALRRIEGLRAEVAERVHPWPTDALTYAPAPHTLYSVHPDAVRAVVESATRRGLRTSVHLAEHPAERRMIELGDGPLPDWFEQRFRQRPDWAPHRPLFDHAAAVGALGPSVLLVHLTDARPEELAQVAASGASVVLCPRSNLFIQARLPPLLAVRAAGIEAALGTDSLASNTSLDVLAEAAALAERFPSVPKWELVKMATWNGARALGRSELGRIARGARPRLFVVDGPVTIEAAAYLLANVRAPRRELL